MKCAYINCNNNFEITNRPNKKYCCYLCKDNASKFRHKEKRDKTSKIWYSKNKEHCLKIKAKYRQENKEIIKVKDLLYESLNKEKRANRELIYREKNKELIAKRKKIWYEKNKKYQLLKGIIFRKYNIYLSISLLREDFDYYNKLR